VDSRSSQNTLKKAAQSRYQQLSELGRKRGYYAARQSACWAFRAGSFAAATAVDDEQQGKLRRHLIEAYWAVHRFDDDYAQFAALSDRGDVQPPPLTITSDIIRAIRRNLREPTAPEGDSLSDVTFASDVDLAAVLKEDLPKWGERSEEDASSDNGSTHSATVRTQGVAPAAAGAADGSALLCGSSPIGGFGPD
jgi:hypothetical protein